MSKLFQLSSLEKIEMAPGKKVIPSSDFAQLLSAEELLAKAKEAEVAFRKEAVEEAEKTKELAFQEGFEEGLSSLNRHLFALDQELKTLRHEIQKNILPLALKAARKIVGEELKLHPERIVDIVLNSLKPVTQHRKIIIYVNREDLKILEENRPKIREIFEHLENLSIQERDDIEQGGCMIETEAGIINAQLENQWRVLESAFEAFKGQQS